MAAPPNMEEGRSSTWPPRFNGNYNGWWKNRMHDYINACHYIPTKEVKDGDLTTTMVKTRKACNEGDRKKIEKTIKPRRSWYVESELMNTTGFLLVRLPKKIRSIIKLLMKGLNVWRNQKLTCKPLNIRTLWWKKVKPSFRWILISLLSLMNLEDWRTLSSLQESVQGSQTSS